MDLLPDFKDLLSALAASSAEYLVVGGWAVSVHSEPRFTKDLDIWIGPDPENLRRVVDALVLFGAPSSISMISAGSDLTSFCSWACRQRGSTS